MLPRSAKLTLKGQSKDAPCDDPTGNGPKGRQVADRSYKIDGLPAADIPSYFSSLKSWWQGHNYQVLTEKSNPQYLWVEKRDDGFRLALDSNDLGEV